MSETEETKEKMEDNEEEYTIVIISDTHNHHNQLKLPNSFDLILHCGDITSFSNPNHLISFNKWLINGNDCLKKLPKTNKVMIAGNHENEANIAFKLKMNGQKIKKNLLNHILTNGTVLNNQTVQIKNVLNQTLIIHGIPWKGDLGN